MLSGCLNLKNVTFPEGITSIPNGMFELSGIEHITIPSTVKDIGEEAFADCDYLTSIVIPEGVEVVRTRTFDTCAMMTTITIPSSVKTIEASAFIYCSSLSVINYLGTAEDWENIAIDETNNEALLTATINYTE